MAVMVIHFYNFRMRKFHSALWTMWWTWIWWCR